MNTQFMKIKSTTKTVVTEKQVITFDNNDFICYQTIINGKLTDQYFTTQNNKKSHPFTYENKNLQFCYYPDLSFVNNKEMARNDWHKIIPEPTIINDLENFSNFDNLLLIWRDMDGYNYKITSPYPLSEWYCKDYIGGFTNENFDLKEVEKRLKTFNWVENIEIREIPYYNRDENNTHGIYFEYNPPQEIIKYICDNKNKINSDDFGIFGTLKGGLDIFGLKDLYKA